MGNKSRLRENILVWGVFSLVYVGTVNTVFAGSPYPSLYSALAAIIPAFILDRYLRSGLAKGKGTKPHTQAKGHKRSSHASGKFLKKVSSQAPSKNAKSKKNNKDKGNKNSTK